MLEYRFKRVVLMAAAAVLTSITAIVASAPALAGAGAQANSNPGVIPNRGNQYSDLAAKWWQWAYSFPRADVPFLNTGGTVDVTAHQTGHVWFLAGSNSSPTIRSAMTVPTGVQLFFPMANFVNDYPCPSEFGFEPPPGETLEHFLQRTGNEALDFFVPDPTTLFAEIDGVPLKSLAVYRATSDLFHFTADPALSTFLDPCITGSVQDGVSIGYWLLLTPLTPGMHTLHFGAPTFGQDITYVVTVRSGRGH